MTRPPSQKKVERIHRFLNGPHNLQRKSRLPHFSRRSVEKRLSEVFVQLSDLLSDTVGHQLNLGFFRGEGAALNQCFQYL